MDKITRQRPQTTTFLKRKESQNGIKPRSFQWRTNISLSPLSRRKDEDICEIIYLQVCVCVCGHACEHVSVCVRVCAHMVYVCACVRAYVVCPCCVCVRARVCTCCMCAVCCTSIACVCVPCDNSHLLCKWRYICIYAIGGILFFLRILPLVEFIYLVFTGMPGVRYCRWA